MNLNTASQHQGVVAWRAITAVNLNPGVDIRHHTHFSFTFHVTTTLVSDAVFEFAAAPALAANPCAPDVFQNIEEVLICSISAGTLPAPDTKLTIPSGTVAGTICTAALPCRPNAFVQVQPVSGDTGHVEVVAILSGPK